MNPSKRVRQLRGIETIKDFAKNLEVSPQLVSLVENGTKNLSIKLAHKLSEKYNVTVNWLFFGDKENDKEVEENIITQKTNADYVQIMEKYIKVLEENNKLKEELLTSKQNKIEIQKNIEGVF